MRLYVALVIYEGIAPKVLDDEAAIRACLEAAVRAGNFSLHDLRVVRFQPQGITAAAIVGESHLAVHTWPEEGRIFVDIASCRDEASVRDALDALERCLPGARATDKEIRSIGR